MIKGLPMLLLAAFVLAASPGQAEEAAATAPVPLSVAVPASSCALFSSAAPSPSLPQFLPLPESRVILCGCGDLACDLKKPYAGCSVDGFPGSCQPGDVCPSQTGKVECYCAPL